MTGTLLYDADCGFCTRTVAWLQKQHMDGMARPWQSVDLDGLGLTVEQVTTAAYWLEPDGRHHVGVEAIAAALCSSARVPLRLLGRALRLPGVRSLAVPAYSIVATNRYRLPGSTSAYRISDHGD